jgi:cytochrome c553
MWQQIIIALLVLGAVGYVAWAFMTMGARQRVLDALATRGLFAAAAARHRARLTLPGCGNCAGHEAKPPAAGRPGRLQR